ncbi:hypothetical protein OROMI_000416 [Orobanche minor]
MSENNKFSVWIVSPFASGGSILSIMAEKYQDGLPEEAISAILRQLLVGILYLGRMGLSHGDLKGGNVLLDRDGTVQISDVRSSYAHYDKNYRRRNPPPYWLAGDAANPSLAYDLKSVGILALELAFGAPRLSLPHLTTPSLRFGYGIKNNTKFTDEFKEFVSLCFETRYDIITTIAHILRNNFLIKHATFNTISLMETLPPIHLRNTKIINSEDEGLSVKGFKILGWNFVLENMNMMPVMESRDRSEDLRSKYVKLARSSFNMNSKILDFEKIEKDGIENFLVDSLAIFVKETKRVIDEISIALTDLNFQENRLSIALFCKRNDMIDFAYLTSRVTLLARLVNSIGAIAMGEHLQQLSEGCSVRNEQLCLESLQRLKKEQKNIKKMLKTGKKIIAAGVKIPLLTDDICKPAVVEG